MCRQLFPHRTAAIREGNTAEGTNALLSLTTGTYNTGVGLYSHLSNTDGKFNTGVGAGAIFANAPTENNTAVGAGALFSHTTGNGNTATGTFALFSDTSGQVNTATGASALFSNTTGSNNVYIGANMQGTAGESDACYIASIFGQTSSGGIPVLINTNHKLGTTTSSKRFKEDIKVMGTVSEALFSLKPVTFHYKKEIDPAGISQLGLVAEEVEKVNPDLVVRDKEGKPYSVRYDQVNAMLLNEFLKEHRKVQQLEKQVQKLTAGLQKVSAQLDLRKRGAAIAEIRR